MSLLSPEECNLIHQAALEVLRDVGVRVDDAGIVQLLQDAGANVSDENVVHIPADLVAWALQECPPTARFADRSGRVWTLGPGADTMVVTGNALYITRGRQRKEIQSQDLADLTRIVDKCEHIHGMVGTAVTDFPPSGRDFVGFHIMARFTNKHLRPCIYTPRGAKLILEMAQVLSDGVSLRERPIVSTGYSIISPLHWSPTGLGAFRETAGLGIPVMINSEPLGGGTAPVTLAGCLVLGDADTLSGIVINQLLETGRPCIYNIGFAHVMDMASTIALTGAPENALLQAAGADLAQFHGLPCASWMSTESLIADGQAALEKMVTGMAHTAHGVNLIWGAGNLESTLAMSPESLLIDNEISGYLHRYQRGIEVTSENLALDLIKEVGLSGDFISTDHTLRHYRQELSRSQLLVRTRRAQWEQAGQLSLEESAQEKVKQILAEEAEIYLDAAQERELERLERYGLAELASA